VIIETFKRYELKYFVPEEAYQVLMDRAKAYMDFDSYCKNGSFYPLYNLYFDCSDHSIMLNSLAKPYYKEKLRIRSYVCNPSDDTKVFVELKKKINKIVCKRRVVLPFASAKAYLLGEQIEIPTGKSSYISQQVLKEIDRFQDFYRNDVSPYSYVAYDRVAMFGKENKEFRLTFDNNIRVHPENEIALDDDKPCSQLLPPGMRLMEIKIAGAIPMWLARTMAELHIQPGSFSKIGRAYQQYQTMIPCAEQITAKLPYMFPNQTAANSK